MSRQRKWQKRQVAEGKCSQCGKERNQFASLCDPCRGEATRRLRERRAKKKLRTLDDAAKGG